MWLSVVSGAPYSYILINIYILAPVRPGRRLEIYAQAFFELASSRARASLQGRRLEIYAHVFSEIVNSRARACV